MQWRMYAVLDGLLSDVWQVASLVTAAALAAVTVAMLVMVRRYRRLRLHTRNAKLRCASMAAKLSAYRATHEQDESQYWQHVRTSAAPVLITTPAGDIRAASPPLLDLLGYASESELQQLKAMDLYVDPRERERRLSATLQEHGEVRNSQFRLCRRNGKMIHVFATARLYKATNGATFYESVLTDITELLEAAEQRERLQLQLNLARKLEAIGQLASGIAHEINTPIQFIGDNAHYLKRAFARLIGVLEQHRHSADRALLARAEAAAGLPQLLEDVADAFEGSFEGIQRVTDIVRAMKEFAHPGDTEKTSTDLNQAVQTTLTVARSEYKQVADIHTELGEIPLVDCRKAEINKVVLNLIVNAAHAIEAASSAGRGRGTITIRTASEAQHVLISIGDTGCGIPKTVMARIFDPFFTTKPVGKGTGQGLAIARSIVHGHGGRLDVESTVGVGTVFTIRLPLTLVPETASAADAPDSEYSIG